MTDRELLERAAKAAGVKIIRITDTGMPLIHGKDENGKHWDSWNPLTDDGDALRLAVKLGLSIVCPSNTSMSSARAWLNPRGDVKVEPDITDPYAATRRAIVRAAAEIGRNMK